MDNHLRNKPGVRTKLGMPSPPRTSTTMFSMDRERYTHFLANASTKLPNTTLDKALRSRLYKPNGQKCGLEKARMKKISTSKHKSTMLGCKIFPNTTSTQQWHIHQELSSAEMAWCRETHEQKVAMLSVHVGPNERSWDGTGKGILPFHMTCMCSISLVE